MNNPSQQAFAIDQASKLLTKRVETKLLAVCDITGIALTIDAPAIGYAMDYTSPLSEPRNFLPLASLPLHTLQAFEAPILAGLVLAVLKNWNILEEDIAALHATQQNLLLQTIPPLVLISYLRFFASSLSTHKDAYSYLPRLSLHPKLEGEHRSITLATTLINHQNQCKNILYPQKDVVELASIYKEVDSIESHKVHQRSRVIAEAILRARRTKEAQQKASLIEARKILKTLASASILSDKFLSFLKILLSGDYLLTAEESTKQRAIIVLERYQIAGCKRLAAILADQSIVNKEESIFSNEDDIAIEEELEALEEEKPKSSLSVLLATRLAASLAHKNLSPEPELPEPESEPESEEIEDFEEKEREYFEVVEEIEEEKDYDNS